MARVLYFDCFSGIAGDMVLGALLDLGLPLRDLQEALGSLGVDHELVVRRVIRSGLSATHVRVEDHRPGADGHDDHRHGPHEHGSSTHTHTHTHDHGHEQHHHEAHAHGSHGHRSLAEIVELIGRSALSADGKARAGAMFQRLAEAEAAIHGIPVSEVHLHEVGAVDSIIDIVGAVFAFEHLGIDDIVSSPLNVGGGTVDIAHGTFPVPAPATLRLLAGVPVYGGGVKAELVTPTGALVVSTYARAYGPLPQMNVERVGYGAGTRDLPGAPNVLRVVIGERLAPPTAAGADPGPKVVEIVCEIDDMSPQLFGPAIDQLFAAGAVDVFLTPVVMKKGRAGTLLTVLAPPERRADLCTVIFRETTTLGVRYQTMAREVLDRAWVEVAVDGGVARVKVASRGGNVLNAAPEFDDCVRLAKATGRSVKSVQADVMRAWATTTAGSSRSS